MYFTLGGVTAISHEPVSLNLSTRNSGRAHAVCMAGEEKKREMISICKAVNCVV